VDISPSNLKKLLDICESVEYDRNTQIIREGEISGYVYFVHKGIIRMCRNNKDLIGCLIL